MEVASRRQNAKWRSTFAHRGSRIRSMMLKEVEKEEKDNREGENGADDEEEVEEANDDEEDQGPAKLFAAYKLDFLVASCLQ